MKRYFKKEDDNLIGPVLSSAEMDFLRKNGFKEIICLTDYEITMALRDWIENADANDLAEMAGNLFGGECEFEDSNRYMFEPNEHYGNRFHK